MAASSSYMRRPLKSRSYSRPNRSRYVAKPYARSRSGRAVVYRSSGETKGVDTSLATANVVSTVATNDDAFVLNLVQQGAGSWNRVGRKVRLSSVRLWGTCEYVYISPAAGTGTVESNTLRMVVVWDSQPSGASIPSFDDVFGTTSQTGTESTTFLDPLTYDNMGRFKVLRDSRICANPNFQHNTNGSVDDVNMTFIFDEYIKLNGRETIFSGQSNPMTIADVSTGALYVYFRAAKNSADSTFSVNADAKARLRYTD